MKTSTTAPDKMAIDLIRRILEQFTYHHKDLIIQAVPVGSSVTLKVQSHMADMPRLIGKQGEHINALTTFVEAIGDRAGVVIRLHLIEPTVGEPGRFPMFRSVLNWNSHLILMLMEDVCKAVFEHPITVESFDSDETSTNIQVTVSAEENRALVARLTKPLNVLFNAVGKANGRILFVDVSANKILASESSWEIPQTAYPKLR